MFAIGFKNRQVIYVIQPLMANQRKNVNSSTNQETVLLNWLMHVFPRLAPAAYFFLEL